MKLLDRIVFHIVSPPAFGLDISDYTVKFMKFTRPLSGGVVVDFFGEIELQEGIVQEGVILKEKEFSLLLKNHLSQEVPRINRKFVIATLPEEKGFVRVIQLPKMRLEEAGKAARWEIEGIVPLPVEKLYFDYAILPSVPASDHMDLLVTVFPKEIVDSYIRVLVGAGLRPVSLELESQAISRALWSGGDGAFVFIDLGATRTSFMIVVGGDLVTTRSTPVISGMHFNKAIADHLGVSSKEANKLKVEIGFSKEYKDSALYEALLPQVSALADELKKEVLFFQEHAEHRHGMVKDISAVILSGGDANLINLASHLSVTLKKPVEIANPLARMFGQKNFYPPFPKNESLRYTTAIGAALRGINP